jgi:hypothetical protein
MSLIYRVKPLFPVSIWRALTAPYWWWYNRARHQAAAVFDGRLRASRRRLEELRNSHVGERCFILGNGPSLAKMDLTPLMSEVTFGLNRVYLLFPKLGFSTTYFVAVNTLVVEQCAEEIKHLQVPKFISWRARRAMRGDDQVAFLDTDYTGEVNFSGDVTGRVFEGSTVTYVALQLAYHLGFSEVILIGVDHSFQAAGRPNVTVVSAGNDPDHFSTDYFPAGFHWQLPDLLASERAYRLAREAFEAAGRRVVDATVGGKLQVFPKVDFEELF